MDTNKPPCYKIKKMYAGLYFHNIKDFGSSFRYVLRQDTFRRNTENQYYLPSGRGEIYAIPIA